MLYRLLSPFVRFFVGVCKMYFTAGLNDLWRYYVC